MTAPADEGTVAEALALAASWQRQALALALPAERRRSRRMARLVSAPRDTALLAALIDRGFRSRSPRRAAGEILDLLERHGTPAFFSLPEKGLLALFRAAAPLLPAAVMPLFTARLRAESRHLVVPAEPGPLGAYLAARFAEGIRVNLNRLGEEVLGEGEAAARMAAYLRDLRDPRIEAVAVKISTLCPRIRPLAFDRTAAKLAARLARLYREAAGQCFTRPDGTRVPKAVNLDMESFRDLELTAAAFRQALDREELQGFSAGMALQAYLPDSFGLLREITAWARRRVSRGGAPIRIRIVKGANLEMEATEAAIAGWPLAPYDDKRDVDANWKRMVAFGLEPENARAVRLGIASHNLFDLAYACVLARRNGVLAAVTVEMLEGMANPQRRALKQDGVDLLTYAPAAAERGFLAAIAFLVRRLDENTGPENFLRHVHGLAPGSAEWERLAGGFRASVRRIAFLGEGSHRTQDRGAEMRAARRDADRARGFRNEPDTDWSLAANRRFAEEIRRRWMRPAGAAPIPVPIVAAGGERAAGRRSAALLDINRLPEKIVVANVALADTADVRAALAAAREDPDGWRRMPHGRRRRILAAAAEELRRARGELIGAAAAVAGKVFTESDPEVSEAVDFAEFYPEAAGRYFGLPHLRCRGKGVGVVISPWNFPIAIPCGGIAAALAAGNTVILKPATDAALVAWLVCRCFWAAGVSTNTLQFLPGEGRRVGARLAASPEVDFVILTGGTDTGLRILRARPDLWLAAETGGKNAIVVTAAADREQAAADAIASAFGHGGQKCSAASLLVLEREVYADAAFRELLADGAAAFTAGSAWDFENATGPLIRPPSGPLKRALEHLEPGERWLLEPRPHPENPHIWSPGIKWNVRPGSFTHTTELFGPVLGVMCAEDLDHAVEIVNRTGYGLTCGLASLDPREQAFFRERVAAGNLYVNRGTTGAVVLRQPFGGFGRSALGAGLKAGGPHYVAQFLEAAEREPPPPEPIAGAHRLLPLVQRWERLLAGGRFGALAAEMRRALLAVRSCLFHIEREFGREIDPVRLRGQDNRLRHLPVGDLVVRLHPDDGLFETVVRIAAAKAAGNRVRVSRPPGLETPPVRFLFGPEGARLCAGVPLIAESDAELAAAVARIDRLRYAAPARVPPEIYAAAAAAGRFVARSPVRMEGRLELLNYFRQQTVCVNFHRYGNLGVRAGEFVEAGV